MKRKLFQGGAMPWLVGVCLLTAGVTPSAAQSLPSPWTTRDVGSPAIAGSANVSSGTFTVKGAGRDIWGSSDQFRFVYQPAQGDIEIVARVGSFQAPDEWAKAGVMIRASLTGASQNVMVAVTKSSGWMHQRRYGWGGTSSSNSPKPPGAAPGWLRLVREGNLFTSYYSTDGSNWTLLGSDAIAMGSTVYVGLAVTSHDITRIGTATFSSVAVRKPSSDNRPPTVSITSPAPGAKFSAPANIAITAAAADTDGTVVRVDFYRGSTLIGSDTSSPFNRTWSSAPAGTYSLTAVATDNAGEKTTSAPVSITVGSSSSNQPPNVSITSPASGATFNTGANVTISASATDADGSVARVDFYRGSTLIGSDTTNPYSVTWSNATAGSHSLTAVARDNAGATRTSAAVTISVGSTSGGAVPSPWANRDVGSPSRTGSASHASGVFTVRGAGADIGGSNDQFHMVHQVLEGDVELIARVDSLAGTTTAKAGLMIREALSAGARNVFVAARPSGGWVMQARTWGGGSTSTLGTRSGSAPGWIRLLRTGNVFTGYTSTDGSSWTQIGTVTSGLASRVRVGLAVTSRHTSTLATGVFSNVAVRKPSGSNQTPTVALTAPSAGATFTAPANITLTASASDPDGSIAKVDFYRGSTLIGSDTSSPYSVAWNSAPAGTYSLTAVATDNKGATKTSAAVSITVNSASNQLPTVSITSPASNSSFTAPASIAVTASASDPDGSVTRVDFYAGSTLIGTDTTNPYSATWSNVAAGTYTLTAIARDDRGASRTSGSVTITVGSAAPAPKPTRVAFAPSADHATGVTSYSVAIRRAGDPVSATPVATRNLGKPTPSNNEISVDISTLIDPLPAGSYYAVVTATGPGGSAVSAPSPNFTK